MNKKTHITIFYLIIVLIFLLSPFIVNYKIFENPGIVYGKYAGMKNSEHELICFVRYKVDGNDYKTEINANLLRENTVKLIYNKKNPKDVILFSVGSLYLAKKMGLIFSLFVFVSAVFFTLKQTKGINIEDDLT